MIFKLYLKIIKENKKRWTISRYQFPSVHTYLTIIQFLFKNIENKSIPLTPFSSVYSPVAAYWRDAYAHVHPNYRAASLYTGNMGIGARVLYYRIRHSRVAVMLISIDISCRNDGMQIAPRHCRPRSSIQTYYSDVIVLLTL